MGTWIQVSAARSASESAARRKDLLSRAGLLHPRHERSRIDRRGRVPRLHPHGGAGRDRPCTANRTSGGKRETGDRGLIVVARDGWRVGRGARIFSPPRVTCHTPRDMKKSIGDNMIPKGWSFERGLELIKKAGFDGVELWLGDMPWFQMSTTDAQVRDLRRGVENAGLVVSNVSTGLHWASPLSARDPQVRAQASRIVERQIETASLLGTDAILVVAGLVTEEVPYNEVYQRCIDALKPLGATAARASVKIG